MSKRGYYRLKRKYPANRIDGIFAAIIQQKFAIRQLGLCWLGPERIASREKLNAIIRSVLSIETLEDDLPLFIRNE